MQNLKAKNAVIIAFAKMENEKKIVNPIIKLKTHIIGNVKIAAVTIRTIPIFSKGLTNEIINNINVNPAKVPRKYIKYALNVGFEKISNIIMKNNQEIMKRITIINKSVFFDRLFKPEINLII